MSKRIIVVVVLIVTCLLFPSWVAAQDGSEETGEFVELTYAFQFGVFGYIEGALVGAEGIAADADGNIYVAESANARVQVFFSVW